MNSSGNQTKDLKRCPVEMMTHLDEWENGRYRGSDSVIIA